MVGTDRRKYPAAYSLADKDVEEIAGAVHSGHPKVISQANSFDIRNRHRYRALVKKAIEHWRPELLAQRSVQNALKRYSNKLKETGEEPYGCNSIVGRLRELLFPRWDLGPAVAGAIFSQRQLGSPMPETIEGTDQRLVHPLHSP